MTASAKNALNGVAPASRAIAGLAAQGSLIWLLRHDLLLAWRRFTSMFGSLRPRTAALIVAIAFLALHALAWPVSKWFAAAAQHGSDQAQMFYPALAAAMMFILPWLISQSLSGTARALYARGDLDLLLASPLPPRRILAARAIAIAVEALASATILIVPLINMLVWFAGLRWLWIYPVLAASALFAASTGIALTLLLFRFAGPRRTRVLAQILATIIAAAFVLTLQVLNVVPAKTRDGLLHAINEPGGSLLLDRDGWLWTPVRALAGEPAAMLAWFALSLAMFAATVWFLAVRFAASAVQSAAVAQTASRKSVRTAHVRFRSGAAQAMRRKEWRLLARDPFLISQIMLQIIYTLPISIVIWRSQGPGGSLAISVAPAIVVIASQIAASLAWLTISGEDAPEFLATAPVTRKELEWRKLQAIALPLALLLALPLAGLTIAEPWAALLALVFAAGASASTAFLNFWHPMPGKRVMMLRRHSQSKLIAMMEHGLALLWAVAVVMAALGTWLALIPLALAAGLLWLNRPRTAPAIEESAPAIQETDTPAVVAAAKG